MKKELIFSAVAMFLGLSLIAGGIISACNKPAQKEVSRDLELIQQYESNEGISIIFRDGKDTFALDYLTQSEMDSFFNIQPVQYFTSGQILPPSYACPDSLIVTDFRGLNRGIAYIEQGILDAGDYQIDSVFHTFCAPYTANSGLQPINFEQD